MPKLLTVRLLDALPTVFQLPETLDPSVKPDIANLMHRAISVREWVKRA
ncbi:hypothetical protein OG741_12765 [Streptomyces sp. NBC_01410]